MKKVFSIFVLILFSFSFGNIKQMKKTEKDLKSITIEPNSSNIYYYEDLKPLRVWIWTNKKYLRQGEKLKIYFKVNKEAYVYIYNTDATGYTYCIFPNYFEQNNYVEPYKTYYIPSTHRYSLKAKGIGGKETLTIVAIAKKYYHIYKNNLPFFSYSHRSPFPKLNTNIKYLKIKLKNHIKRNDIKLKKIEVEPNYNYYHEDYRIDPYYAEKTIILYVSRHRIKKPEYAIVSIDSYPHGAKVKINGKKYGYTPIEIKLKRGKHYKIELYKKHYEKYKTYYYIGYGKKEYDLFFELQPKGFSFKLNIN